MFQNTDSRNRPVLDELQMIPLMLIQRKKTSILPPPSPARGNPEIPALLKPLWHILELANTEIINLLFPTMFTNVFCSSSKYKAARKLSAIYIKINIVGNIFEVRDHKWTHLLNRTESTKVWDLSLCSAKQFLKCFFLMFYSSTFFIVSYFNTYIARGMCR